MNDALVAFFILGGTFVLAVAIDRGIPNALESAAYLLEDLAAGVVASLRQAAEKLRARHAQIEAGNHRQRSSRGSALQPVTKRRCNAA